MRVNPATWVRVTANDSIFFKIPRNKLFPAGLKRLLRLERYNNWKISVLAEAKRLGFSLPEIGAGVTFFIPVPKSWSKKKKKLHHGQFHQSKPDLSNLLKAWEDALLVEDKQIAHYTHLGKRWVDATEGWIEVIITDPTQLFIEPPSIEGESRLL